MRAAVGTRGCVRCFPAVELTLLVGSYAIAYYLPRSRRSPLDDRDGRCVGAIFCRNIFVLPHPSWRTIGWQRDNPWFESEALPELRARIGRCSVPRRSIRALDPLHVLVAEAEMMADLMDQHVPHQMPQIFAGLAPVIEDRPAVEKDHVEVRAADR